MKVAALFSFGLTPAPLPHYDGLGEGAMIMIVDGRPSGLPLICLPFCCGATLVQFACPGANDLLRHPVRPV